MPTHPLVPPVRVVTEIPVPADPDVRVHPGWRVRHRWLVQGVTVRGPDETPHDFSLFAGSPAAEVVERWRRLRAATGLDTLVHALQVHGATVRHHRESPPGIVLAEPCDGHLTRAPGLLLTVTVADCVPVTLVAPGVRAVAVIHAGWRGVAAGIVEGGVEAFRRRLGVAAGELEAHLGPAICGECYEVGPEVHAGLGLDRPERPLPVDLRAVAAARLAARGVPAAAITRSSWCTRCGESPFFSHRGGDGQRQLAFVGMVG